MEDRTTAYVVDYFKRQEKAARREADRRRELQQTIEGKVEKKQLSDDYVSSESERNALLRQVLRDCEESTKNKLTSAWGNEKEFRRAFSMLQGFDGEEVLPLNPLQVKWASQTHVHHAKEWGATKAKDSAPRRKVTHRPEQKETKDYSAELTPNAQQTASEETLAETVLAPQEESKAKDVVDSKPWRAAWSSKRIRSLERKHKKRDARKKKVLKRKSTRVRNNASAATAAAAAAIEKKRVPKLEMYPTYGPQNSASRALRKHKGRKLNSHTAYQHTISRAKHHRRRIKTKQQQAEEEAEQKKKQIRDRLAKLDKFAKKKVGVYELDRQKSDRDVVDGEADSMEFTGQRLMAQCKVVFEHYDIRKTGSLPWPLFCKMLHEVGVVVKSEVDTTSETYLQAVRDGQTPPNHKTQVTFKDFVEFVEYGESLGTNTLEAEPQKSKNILLVWIRRQAARSVYQELRLRSQIKRARTAKAGGQRRRMGWSSNKSTASEDAPSKSAKMDSAAKVTSGGRDSYKQIRKPLTEEEKQKKRLEKERQAELEKRQKEEEARKEAVALERARQAEKERTKRLKQVERDKARKLEEERQQKRQEEARIQELRLKSESGAIKAAERTRERERQLARQRRDEAAKTQAAKQRMARDRQKRQYERQQRRLTEMQRLEAQKRESRAKAKIAVGNSDGKLVGLLRSSVSSLRHIPKKSAPDSMLTSLQAVARNGDTPEMRAAAAAALNAMQLATEAESTPAVQETIADARLRKDQPSQLENHEVMAILKTLFGGFDPQTSSPQQRAGPELWTKGGPRELGILLDHLGISDNEDALAIAVQFLDGGAGSWQLQRIAVNVPQVLLLDDFLKKLPPSVVREIRSAGPLPAYFAAAAVRIQAVYRGYLARKRFSRLSAYRRACMGPAQKQRLGYAQLTAPECTEILGLFNRFLMECTNASSARDEINAVATTRDAPDKVQDHQQTQQTQPTPSDSAASSSGPNGASSGHDSGHGVTKSSAAEMSESTPSTDLQDKPEVQSTRTLASTKAADSQPKSGNTQNIAMEAIAETIGVLPPRRSRARKRSRRRARKNNRTGTVHSTPSGDGEQVVARSQSLLKTQQFVNGASQIESLCAWLGISFDSDTHVSSADGRVSTADVLAAASVTLNEAAIASHNMQRPEPVNLHWFLMLLPSTIAKKLRSDGYLAPFQGRKVAATLIQRWWREVRDAIVRASPQAGFWDTMDHLVEHQAAERLQAVVRGHRIRVQNTQADPPHTSGSTPQDSPLVEVSQVNQEEISSLRQNITDMIGTLRERQSQAVKELNFSLAGSLQEKIVELENAIRDLEMET